MILSLWIRPSQSISSFCLKSLNIWKSVEWWSLDDIFQGGDVAKDIMEVRRGQRTIYRGLQRFFDATLDNPGLTATLVPLGDGILMLRKNLAEVELPESE